MAKKAEKTEKVEKPEKPAKKSEKKVEEKPDSKLEPPPLPSTGDALGWVGEPVDDSGGQRVGKVSGVYADLGSKEPKWLVVRLGRLAGEAAVPFEHCVEGGGRVWIAYEREEVRGSPKLNGGEPLNAGQELQICEHYGIRIGLGRAAEVAERKGDEVTAVPAG